MVKKKKVRKGQEPSASDRAEERAVEEEGEASRSASATVAEKEKGTAQEYLDHLQRVQAEFANYRKRVQREMLEAYDYAKAGLVCKLLPVVDDFERAIESLTPGCKNDEAVRGMRLIYEKLKNTLEAEGVEAIECRGQEFDPNLHEAMLVTKVTEGEDSRIVKDFQKGYTYKGKLIRPSKVEVTQLQTDSGDE